MGALAVSPDGSAIALRLRTRRWSRCRMISWLQPVAGGAPKNFTGATLDRPIDQPKWIDAQTIVASVARGFRTTLASIAR